MNLHSVDATKDPHICALVKGLYHRAFPDEERLPWWVLRLNSLRQHIDLTAWMDGDQFCGFTSSVTVEGLHFLLFFAVAEDCRSRGYGSAILQAIQEGYISVWGLETLGERECVRFTTSNPELRPGEGQEIHLWFDRESYALLRAEFTMVGFMALRCEVNDFTWKEKEE